MSAVERQAADVLAFWFDEVGKARWFAKDEALDREIGERFGAMRAGVLEADAAGWRDDLASLTAAVILLDQFSRNMFRGQGRAFEADPLALALAFEALDKGWTHAAPRAWRQFLLMPLMHSEALAVQDRSVEEFDRLGDGGTARFARRHRDQIARFGRFPGRNRALGRESSPAEEAALAAGAAF